MGRSLSDLQGCSGARAELSAELGRLRRRLQELRSVLKPHASKAVIDSIDYWNEWLDHPRTAYKKTLSNEEAVREVRPALVKQVRRWRGVLTGEKNSEDLLSSSDYLTAGSGIVDGYMRLALAYGRRWFALSTCRCARACRPDRSNTRTNRR